MSDAYTYQDKRSLKAIADILRVLGEKRMGRAQLQEALHMTRPTARRYLAHLQAEPRRIFVCRWERTEGRLRPIYAVGNQKDAAQPKIATPAERRKAAWQAIKADPAKHHHVLRTARVAAAVARTRAAPQTWLSALLPGPVGAKRTGLAPMEGMQ